MEFKGTHFQKTIVLQCIRWYLAYPLSYRNLEEMMAERGVSVDHWTINRWVVRYSPKLAAAFSRRKRRVGTSWRMDETYIKVRGTWKFFYRAVDKQGQTIDFLLTARRGRGAALRFLRRAIDGHRVPVKINVAKSGFNKSAILAIAAELQVDIECRQCKYLNNIVEQDHRAPYPVSYQRPRSDDSCTKTSRPLKPRWVRRDPRRTHLTLTLWSFNKLV